MLRAVFKDSAVYGLGNVAIKLVGILALPIFTRYMTSTEYGGWDIIQMLAVFAHLLIGLELVQATVFYGSSKIGEDRKRYFSTALFVSVFLYSLGCLIIYTFSENLTRLFLQELGDANFLKAGCLWIFSYGLLNLLLNQCRAEKKALLFAFLSLFNTLLSVALSLYLLIIAEWGVSSLVWGYGLGSTVTFLLALFKMRKSLSFCFHQEKLKELLLFSLPLIPSTAAVFGQTYVDRMLINHFLGLDDVGIYGVAFRIAALLQMVTYAFQTAYTPILFQNARNQETVAQLKRIFLHFHFLIFVCAVGLLSFLPEVFYVMVGQEFYQSLYIAPWLVSSLIVMALPLFFPGLWIEKKTGILALVNLTGVVVNFIFNLYMIPHYGVVGAALATLIAGVFTAFLHFYLSKRYYPISYQWMRWGGSVSLCSICVYSILNYWPVIVGINSDLIAVKMLIVISVVSMLATILIREDVKRIFNWVVYQVNRKKI